MLFSPVPLLGLFEQVVFTLAVVNVLIVCLSEGAFGRLYKKIITQSDIHSDRSQLHSLSPPHSMGASSRWDD